MTDRKIHPKLDELLSAFLDGEASAEETHVLLDRLGQDPRLSATLHHHYRLRASLRGELHPGLDDGFANRVMAGIEAVEGDHAAKVVALKPRRLPTVMRTTFGLAIAASVAAVAVLSVQTLLPSNDSTFPALTTADVRRADTADEAVAVATAPSPESDSQRWEDLSPDAATELNNYLISHNNSAMDHGLNGTLGFMRVAADDGIDFGEAGR